MKRQLEEELESIFTVRPDLILVCLSDGAADHWEFLNELAERLGVKDVRRAVDFFHVAERVKKALDVYHGEGSAESRAEFEKHYDEESESEKARQWANYYNKRYR